MKKLVLLHAFGQVSYKQIMLLFCSYQIHTTNEPAQKLNS